ncbi:hypothetical protein KW795_00340 [Candidatus Microgenomates bacterium]|nr:hypothetical protein [Candidatus Microgenomates bacterium]
MTPESPLPNKEFSAPQGAILTDDLKQKVIEVLREKDPEEEKRYRHNPFKVVASFSVNGVCRWLMANNPGNLKYIDFMEVPNPHRKNVKKVKYLTPLGIEKIMSMTGQEDDFAQAQLNAERLSLVQTAISLINEE